MQLNYKQKSLSWYNFLDSEIKKQRQEKRKLIKQGFTL